MTHDDLYLQYLQSMFGNTSVSFFGIIIVIITLILMCIIVILNSTNAFLTPIIKIDGDDSLGGVPLTHSIII